MLNEEVLRRALSDAEMLNPSSQRICEAYIMMAQTAKYRPAAPSDGFGKIDLNPAELQSNVLAEEAGRYAGRFILEENHWFNIGVSNFSTVRALVFTIEAARLLCAGEDELAAQLLLMAGDEIIKRVEEEEEAACLNK